MGKGQRIPPLTDEPPMLFRPSLAAVFGIEGALVLERAHELQYVRGGFEARFGRVCFTWSSRQRNEDFRGVIKHKTLSRVMERLTGLSDNKPDSPTAEPPSRETFPLVRISWREAGKSPDKDWYSVNYGAVGEASKLFPTASVGELNLVKMTKFSGQIDQNSGQIDQENGQIDHASRTRSTLNSIQKASLLAGLFEGGENPDPPEIAAAMAALAEFGIAREVGLDLLRTLDGQTERILALCDSTRRLRDAGYRFHDALGAGYVFSGIRGGWHALSDEEIAGKVSRQRGGGRRPSPAGAPNLQPASEQAKERALAERFRRQEYRMDVQSPLEWEALIERAKPIWAAQYEDAFPSERTRSNPRVRAIVRGLLFPIEAGVKA